MSTTKPQTTTAPPAVPELKLRYFTWAQIIQLEHLLDDVGEYGELRLIVQKRRVRFAQVVKSRSL